MRLLKAWEQEREPHGDDHEAEPARELQGRDISPALEDVDSEQRQGGIDERVHQEDGPEPEDEHGDEVCASLVLFAINVLKGRRYVPSLKLAGWLGLMVIPVGLSFLLPSL